MAYLKHPRGLACILEATKLSKARHRKRAGSIRTFLLCTYGRLFYNTVDV
jgi:hypothetical protein